MIPCVRPPFRHLPFRGHALVALVLLFLAGTVVAGCSKREVTAPVAVNPTPPLDTPEHVLLALQWALENLDFATLRTLFTADYVFVFASQDSAGNAFRDTPWGWEDEIACSLHLLIGGSQTEPPVDRITLDFTNNLVVFPSTLPGHDPKWHKTIRAEVNLRFVRGESTLEVRGPSLFYFVRGDSAAIPQALIDEGVHPDSTRWWIDRWEDDTLSSAVSRFAIVPPADPNPTQATSWGRIKVLYR